MLFHPPIIYTSTWRFFLSASWAFEGPADSVFRIQFIDLDLHVGLQYFVLGTGLDFFDLEPWRFGINGRDEPLDMISDSNRMTIMIASYTDAVNGSILVKVTAIPKPGMWFLSIPLFYFYNIACSTTRNLYTPAQTHTYSRTLTI